MANELPKGSLLRGQTAGYLASVAVVAAVTFALAPLRAQISITGVALCLLLSVLLTATIWGSRPAMLASILAMFSFNFFFIPPVGTLSIADPENWVALVTFLIVAVTTGQMSARLKVRAEQAENARSEAARLYDELNQAFEKASEAEAAKRSDKLKSALLDAVSHDMRTPLTSIKASVTMLIKERRDPPGTLTAEMKSELLTVIDEETDRLDQFVEGMIEMARIDAGDLKLGQTWASVEEILGDAINRAKPRLNGRSIEVEIENELPSIRVDARSISEALYNLIENAAKYSPSGSKVLVRAGRSGSELVSFSVDDEGPGIVDGLSSRLFEKFVRGRGVCQSGQGLGLAIAKGIVEAHGGQIGARNIETGGASFYFSLPIGDD